MESFIIYVIEVPGRGRWSEMAWESVCEHMCMRTRARTHTHTHTCWPQFLWWLESRARRMTPMQTWLAWFESLANIKGWEHPGSLISSMWAQEEVEGYGLKAPSCQAYKHGVGLTISRHESSLAVVGWDPLWWVHTVRYDAAFLCLFAVPASLSPFLLQDQVHHLNHDGSWIFSFLSTSQAAGKGNE